ncbi:MAG: phytase [Pseudomonadota bacterium]
MGCIVTRASTPAETDGIEVISGSFGPDYPGGLMVVQDGSNEARTQNFKLISWQKVLIAMAAQ